MPAISKITQQLQEQDFTMPFGITELLLQSYGEVIRLFPAWPREQIARFHSLRAEVTYVVTSLADLVGSWITFDLNFTVRQTVRPPHKDSYSLPERELGDEFHPTFLHS